MKATFSSSVWIIGVCWTEQEVMFAFGPFTFFFIR